MLPDKNLLQVIRKDLNEDPARLERQMELFKQWLKREPHLPKDVDEHLIQTFVRSSKCNLEKSKKKFENFLAYRIKLKTYYINRNFNEHFFKSLTVHRQFIICPALTPKGYRVVMYRFPQAIEDYIFEELMRYLLFLLDFLFYEDISAAFIFICDLKEITVKHIAETNMGDALRIIDLAYNISPLRMKEIHFFNLPKIAEVFVNLLIKAMSEKIQKRVQMHQAFDVTTCIPKQIVPEELGGSGKSFSEHGDSVKSFCIRNPDWSNKAKSLKLAGAPPSHKKDLYSFDEFEMEGSFRKLSID